MRTVRPATREPTLSLNGSLLIDRKLSILERILGPFPVDEEEVGWRPRTSASSC